jgi:uncharacterized protein (UPF0548 family)
MDGVDRLRWTAGWGVGIPVALWRHATYGLRIERRQSDERGPDPGPTDRFVPGDPGPVQTRADGAGPAFRRRYAVRIHGARRTPEDVMADLARDPNAAAPFEVGRFVKTRGRLGEMRVGDEYLVWMPGPWNGPVRVAERTPTSFRLATLDGHMEAGEIEFRFRREDPAVVFEIESAARSGTVPFWFAYGPLRLAREAQLHMWARFCHTVVGMTGGSADRLVVETRRFPDDHGEPPPRSRRVRRDLASLARREVNFPHASLEDVSPGEGWVVDDHAFPLGEEEPGPPHQGGLFAAARDLVRGYQFADPSLISAVYDPREPMEGRNMLLRGRFLGLTFHLGCRVVRVVEDTVTEDGHEVDRWGWSYRTLQGHLEMGQMDFWVVKRRDTGEVAFRIHAVSKPARIPNPVIRLGFRLFGRGLQLRFARLAGARMRTLVDARMRGHVPESAVPAPEVHAVEGGAAP